jgi:hypothetical protein
VLGGDGGSGLLFVDHVGESLLEHAAARGGSREGLEGVLELVTVVTQLVRHQGIEGMGRQWRNVHQDPSGVWGAGPGAVRGGPFGRASGVYCLAVVAGG